ncbi:MAG: biosynthetic-type acetolactate synthase large subunit [Oscillospiraceae bacterium]|nr:biosynthetic-type acetolactate synthase large subunit [Oscillospiraceae bacterium]
MKLSGADIIVESLIEQGVDTVFGYPGGWILHVYDSLYRYSDKINHILVAHEQGAAHAADGYSRASGKVGVCLATAGPGATNLVTGIATAYMDSIPMVAITCNVNRGMLGKDSFQEIDIVGVTSPITKHNFIVKRPEDIAPTIRRAFEIANSGRKGPVLVDITKDATGEEAEFESLVGAASCRPSAKDLLSDAKDLSSAGGKMPPLQTSSTFTDKDIYTAVGMIESSEKPLIFIGGGVISSDAGEQLAELQKLVDAPVTHSLMGIGGFDRTNEMSTGMLGMHGSKVSSLAIKNCDLLIAIGTRFSDRVTCNTSIFAKNTKILHIDIDRAEINKNICVDEFILGDVKDVLTALNKKLKPAKHDTWTSSIKEWKLQYPTAIQSDHFTAQEIIRTIGDTVDRDNTVICTDVGQHQMWTAQNYPFTTPRTFVSSGGLGTMGFGLGAAIGAKISCPDKTVINITGDGCFHMNMNEISTAVTYKIPVIDIIINNNVLGMVRQWQRMFYDKRFSNTTLDKKTNYDMVAQGLGAVGVTVRNQAEFKAALETAMKQTDTPTVINCVVDPDLTVFPMVPPGADVEDPIME